MTTPAPPSEIAHALEQAVGFFRQRRLGEAEMVCARILQVSPDHFDTLNFLGVVRLQNGRFAEALAAFDRACALQPQSPSAHMNRGIALAELGRLSEALGEFDRALAVQPGNPQTHFNRGTTLNALGRFADAVAAFDRALAINPRYVAAHTNRGMALQSLGRHRDALESFRSVIAIDHGNADAHHNEALILLTLGDYRAGWPKYEYRWQRTGMPAQRRDYGKPLWLGEEPLAGKTILLHAEQGLGDTIQFVRYVPLLAGAGARVVIEAQSELAGLLSRVDGVTGVVKRGDDLPDFDVHCPVGSLPLAFKTELASIPSEIPYLKANEEHIAKWRARLSDVSPPRVAVVWAGSAAHPNDRNRSVPFATFSNLFAQDRARFISIQRDLRSEDTLTRCPQVVHVGNELADFDDTAAVVSLADVVITVDTSVAHLAGALGRPTWILVPFWPDWRWSLGRTDSPWYPTVRLFRQPVAGDWDSVLTRVKVELGRR